MEAFLQGQELTDALAADAAELAVVDALPLSDNEPKVMIAKALVTQAIKSLSAI